MRPAVVAVHPTTHTTYMIVLSVLYKQAASATWEDHSIVIEQWPRSRFPCSSHRLRYCRALWSTVAGMRTF